MSATRWSPQFRLSESLTLIWEPNVLLLEAIVQETVDLQTITKSNNFKTIITIGKKKALLIYGGNMYHSGIYYFV